MIQQRVTKYIEKEHLFSPDDKILVALSGGADSVALLFCIQQAIITKPHIVISTCEAKSQTGTVICPPTLRKNGKSIYIPLILNTTQYATENIFPIEMAAMYPLPMVREN